MPTLKLQTRAAAMTTRYKHDAIHEEYQRFREALPKLCKTLEGRWVVFKDGEVHSNHLTESDAQHAAIEEFGLGNPYVIARVEKEEPTPVTAGVIFGFAPQALG